MLKFIAGIEPQPHFPIEDISSQNVERLPLVLASKTILEESHRMTETVSRALRIGREAIGHSLGTLYPEHDEREAINHGIAVFEAIHNLVASELPSQASTRAVKIELLNIAQLSRDDLAEHVDKASKYFYTHKPSTVEVVQESVERFYPHNANHALLGAALAHNTTVRFLSH